MLGRYRTGNIQWLCQSMFAENSYLLLETMLSSVLVENEPHSKCVVCKGSVYWLSFAFVCIILLVLVLLCICSFLCQVMQQKSHKIFCFLFACHGYSPVKFPLLWKGDFFSLAQALECYIKAWFRKHPPACQVTQQWCPPPWAWKRDWTLQRNGDGLVPTGQDDRKV